MLARTWHTNIDILFWHMKTLPISVHFDHGIRSIGSALFCLAEHRGRLFYFRLDTNQLPFYYFMCQDKHFTTFCQLTHNVRNPSYSGQTTFLYAPIMLGSRFTGSWSHSYDSWLCEAGLLLPSLTHWGRVTHICVGNLTIIVSDNGLSPGRY